MPHVIEVATCGRAECLGQRSGSRSLTLSQTDDTLIPVRHLRLISFAVIVMLISQIGVTLAEPIACACDEVAGAAADMPACCRGMKPGSSCPMHLHHQLPARQASFNDKATSKCRFTCDQPKAPWIASLGIAGVPPVTWIWTWRITSDVVLPIPSSVPVSLPHAPPAPPPRLAVFA